MLVKSPMCSLVVKKMSKAQDCCVGGNLNIPCNLISYIKEIGIINFIDLNEEQQELLILRTGLRDISTICFHHMKGYLDKYSLHQTKCCDPFHCHKKIAKGKYLLL